MPFPSYKYISFNIYEIKRTDQCAACFGWYWYLLRGMSCLPRRKLAHGRVTSYKHIGDFPRGLALWHFQAKGKQTLPPSWVYKITNFVLSGEDLYKCFLSVPSPCTVARWIKTRICDIHKTPVHVPDTTVKYLECSLSLLG